MTSMFYISIHIIDLSSVNDVGMQCVCLYLSSALFCFQLKIVVFVSKLLKNEKREVLVELNLFFLIQIKILIFLL